MGGVIQSTNVKLNDQRFGGNWRTELSKINSYMGSMQPPVKNMMDDFWDSTSTSKPRDWCGTGRVPSRGMIPFQGQSAEILKGLQKK